MEDAQEQTQEIQDNGENHDRITELPDLILSIILSKLTTKDVVKTSALNSKWRSLWALKHNLNFDIPNMFGAKYERPNIVGSYYEIPMFSLDSYFHFRGFRLHFMKRVDAFLRHFPGTKIFSFKVEVFVDSEVTFKIDQWIRSAITLGVEQLELLFSNRPFFRAVIPKESRYRFPHWLFQQSSASVLKTLHLEKCILRPSDDFNGFSKLKTLYLKEMILSEEFLESLFSNCLLLEDLRLEDCIFSSILKVVSPSLHNLAVLRCLKALKVEISAINLTAFEFQGDILKLNLIVAPRLVKIFCYSCGDDKITYALSQFTNIPSLEILSMHMDSGMISNIPRRIASFRNLKQLELFIFGLDSGDQDLLWVLTILNASPLLQKLTLTFLSSEFYENQREIRKPCGCIHDRLKQVEIGGCVGNWYEIELITYILKNAIALDRVTFSPSRRIYAGGEKWIDLAPASSWLESGREMVRKALQNDVPAGVQLALL